MLRLRPYKACDAKKIVSWITDEEMFYKWSAGRYNHYPITAEDMNKYYDAFAYDDNFYEMTAFDETGAVGHMIMRFTDAEKKNLRFGFIIVDGEKRGKGLGKQMLKIAVRYAFDVLFAERITIGVFENNPAAYNCYKSIGFNEPQPPQYETYHLMNEDWKCIELEM